MKSFLKALLIHNWPRKCLALALAIMIWLLVNHSLIETKVIRNIPIKVDHLPKGKVAESSRARMTVDLTLQGRKSALRQLNDRNLVVVFDGKRDEREWIATVRKENIQTTLPQLDLAQAIRRVSKQNVLIKLVNQVTENIPIEMTAPIGKAPAGYEFVSIWPNKLYVSVTGSETALAKFKKDRLNLTFNLNKIDKQQLDHLTSVTSKQGEDVVSFFVPSAWKKVSLGAASTHPIVINDPQAKELRITFLRRETLEVDFPIPITLYFQPGIQSTARQHSAHLTPSSLVTLLNETPILQGHFFIKGVSPLFLNIIKNRLTCVVVVPPHAQPETPLSWSLELINRPQLEKHYIQSLLSSDARSTSKNQEPYFKSLFQHYSDRLQLFTSPTERLEMSARLSGDTIVLETTPSA